MIRDGIVIVERSVRAPRSAVYAFLMTGDQWARWQGIAASVTPLVGGSLTVKMPNGDVATGHFVELVPDRRIVFTWGWTGNPVLPPGSSTVELELLDDVDGTVIRVTHRDLPPDATALHEAGWERYIVRLVVVSEGGTPEPDAFVG